MDLGNALLGLSLFYFLVFLTGSGISSDLPIYLLVGAGVIYWVGKNIG